jgi:MFS superfamily sulfate permease-like transporter
MLTGIGILIVANQIHVMVDDRPRGTGLENLRSIPEAVQKGLPWPNLGSRADRRNELRFIQTLGTLHSDQLQLEERVSEAVPHDATPEQAAMLHRGLKPLAPAQQQIAKQLDAVSTELGQSPGLAAKNGKLSGLRVGLQVAKQAATQAATDLEEEDGAKVRASQAAVVQALHELRVAAKNHDSAAKIGLLTILVLMVWKGVGHPALKLIPAPLVAVLVATGVAAAGALPVLYVEVPHNLLGDLHTPALTVMQTMPWAAILQSAFVVALVASAETLLCCTAVDQLHQGVRTNYDRELSAQGIGNMTCGLLGALPLTGVIVRSAANVQAGATSRWSAVLHGLWLLLFVALLGFLLRLIPTASLAAMLVYTGFRLVNWRIVPELWKVGKGEVVVFLATVGTIVVEDLLTGVIVGIVLSAGRLLLTFTRFDTEIETDPVTGDMHISLNGAATFIRLPRLALALDKLPTPGHIHVHTERLTYLDHACWVLLFNWFRQQVAAGGTVHVDWDGLRRRGQIRRDVMEEMLAEHALSDQPQPSQIPSKEHSAV